MTPLKVSQVARLAKVTVRTLHHFDALGLVRPSHRSAAGYRLYTHADLERLRDVLTWRALGFPLEAIGRLLQESGDNRKQALRRQRQHLVAEQARLARVLAAVDDALAAHHEGVPMEPGAMFEGFDANPYEAEAQQRWGQSDAWKESKRRTAKYTKADWQRFQAEQAAWGQRAVQALAASHQPGSAEARALAEAHRLSIERWFYACPHAMHRHLGQMYVADERFMATYERLAPGLARWLCEAIQANADRAEGR